MKNTIKQFIYYHNMERKKSKLSQPWEYKLVKLTSLGLCAFVVTVLAASIFAPVQSSNASGEILMAVQANNGTISLQTTATPINLSLTATSVGSVRTVADTVYVTSTAAGYQLYMSAVGSSASLLREGGSTSNSEDQIPTLSGATLQEPANLGNNTWGFALGQGTDVVTNGFDSEYGVDDNSNASNKFAAIPTKGNDILVAKRSTSADAVPTTFYYGAKVNTAKASGLYKNTITYTAIGNSSATGLASISPERTNKVTGGEIITISTPSTATLESAGAVTVTIADTSCAEPIVSKNGIYINVKCTAPALATGWHEVTVSFAGSGESYVVNPGIEYYTSSGTVANMQDFTVSDCASMYTNQTITLRDARDGQTYTVRKMVDGNCWMGENLRLGTTIMDGGEIEINSDSSDYTGDSFVISSDNITTADNASPWSTDNYEISNIYARSADEVDINGNTYGNPYNWYTVTAKSGNTSVTTATSVASSICPKNWKLPPFTGIGSYSNLLKVPVSEGGLGITKNGTTYNNTGMNAVIFDAPYNYALAGAYSASRGSLTGMDTDEISELHEMTRTTSISTNVKYFSYFTDSRGIVLDDGYYRYNGYSARCIFQPSMQNFTTTTCSNLETAKQASLVDIRDLNVYTIAKLADGNCWMTTNLMLGNTITSTGTININSTTSDYSGTAFNISSSNITTAGNNWDSTPEALHIYARQASYADTNGHAYGNIYNWYTATAKSGTSGVTSGNAANSICPKSWKLPNNSTTPSFTTLFQVSSTDGGLGVSGTSGTNTTVFAANGAITTSPYNFAWGGNYTSGNLSGFGSNVYYWSRTATGQYAYGISFNTSGTYDLQHAHYKYMGFHIRCIFSS